MTRADDAASIGHVTDLDSSGSGHRADGAVQAADAAALAAGVSVREITELEHLDAVQRLYDEIWRPDKSPPVTTELLRAFAKAGNYVAGAFDDGRLVGACVGFFAAPAEDVTRSAIHSHIAGVSTAVRGRQVGFALKLHQRAWALLRGVETIAWTFDPLVSRNAYFNLAKLSAQPVEYLPNFYGGMRDGINGGDDTDRLLVHWDLQAPEVVAACTGQHANADAKAERARGGVVALGISELGAPVAGSLDGQTSLVAVPHGIEALRASDPGRAKEWRAALRESLVTLMADGGRVCAFDRTGWYIVRRGVES
ncbi:MAG: GNAT family N-acetyltransferase [Jatrophihabitantaceae bacterium]